VCSQLLQVLMLVVWYSPCLDYMVQDICRLPGGRAVQLTPESKVRYLVILQAQAASGMCGLLSEKCAQPCQLDKLHQNLRQNAEQQADTGHMILPLAGQLMIFHQGKDEQT